MFVYSMRASTLKFFAVVCVALVALITLIAFVPSYEAEYASTAAGESVVISYDKIKSNEDRINFLSQLGWQVKGEPVSVEKVTVPDTFDKILMGYNEIQKGQGLDLMKYKGNYYRIGLLDSSFGIIDDGNEATIHCTPNSNRPITITNDLGICVVMPMRFEGEPDDGTVIIEA